MSLFENKLYLTVLFFFVKNLLKNFTITYFIRLHHLNTRVVL